MRLLVELLQRLLLYNIIIIIIIHTYVFITNGLENYNKYMQYVKKTQVKLCVFIYSPLVAHKDTQTEKNLTSR